MFIAVIAVVVFAVSNSRINTLHDVTPVALAVTPSAEMVERGKELATFRGCRDCHGEDLGGRVVGDAMPVMVLAGSNITPGGVVKGYTLEDWARVIRHGVKPDKRSVRFMPSFEYTELSHEDLAAIIAYAQSVPAIEAEAAPFVLGPLGRVLYLAGELPLLPAEMVDHDATPAKPVRGPTREYGRYLASSCIGCHGPNLSGGPIPGVPPDWPPASNLTLHESGLAAWSFDGFKQLFRTGKRPDGTEIQQAYMPVKHVSESSTDDDLKALWEYIASLEPVAVGVR